MHGKSVADAPAYTVKPIYSRHFNSDCTLPYGLEPRHIRLAMIDFAGFLGFLNRQLRVKGMPRLECFLMPASFSGLVGEFINLTLPKYCLSLVKNMYHNGHPDLIPAGVFARDAVQYTHEGIEVKASRHPTGWQGHNPESVWLMVFHFESNTPMDAAKRTSPRPFLFRGVYAAKLEKGDWAFSGRAGASRRTITASVRQSGVEKMKANWVYRLLDEA